MRKAFSLLCIATLLNAGCGTILHPERKGQVSGRIDPAIAVLDGLGLLLFFVPGVIAFAVDFSNGTIYLPNTAKSTAVELPQTLDGHTAVALDTRNMTTEDLAHVVADHAGLDAAQLHTMQTYRAVSEDGALVAVPLR